MQSDVSVVKVVDSRLETKQTKTFATPLSVDSITKHIYKADTCSQHHIKWNAISTPGGTYFINDRWYVRGRFRFTIDYHMKEGEKADYIARDGRFGMRFLPLTSCTHHISLMVNGSQEIQTYPREYIHAIAQYQTQDQYKELYSGCPHRKCKVQEFCDAYGTLYNSLGTQGDYEDDTGNGTLSDMVVNINELGDPEHPEDGSGNSKSKFEFVVSFVEPVYADPLRFDSNRGNGSSIWRLNTFTLDYTLSNLARMLCIDLEPDPVDGETRFKIDNVTVMPEEAHLLLEIANVDERIVPPVWTKGLRERHVDRVSIGDVGSGEVKDIVTPVINLLNYPQKIYVFVREDVDLYEKNMDELSVRSTDTFAQILNVEIEMMNQRNILKDHTPHDLYRVAMNNGLKDTPYCNTGILNRGFDFVPGQPTINRSRIGMTGSVLCFTVGADILIPDKLLVPNAPMDSRNFQMHITFRNINTHRSLNMAVYLVFESFGTIDITDRFVKINRTPVTMEEIIKSPQVTDDGSGMWAAGNAVGLGEGGGLIDGGGSKLGKILGIANTVTGAAKEIAGIADTAVGSLKRKFGGGYGFDSLMGNESAYGTPMNIEAGQALYGPDLGISPY